MRDKMPHATIPMSFPVLNGTTVTSTTGHSKIRDFERKDNQKPKPKLYFYLRMARATRFACRLAADRIAHNEASAS